jgi:hypothetical protein
MLFKNPVRTSKRTPYFTITKINWLTLFKFKDRRPLNSPHVWSLDIISMCCVETLRKEEPCRAAVICRGPGCCGCHDSFLLQTVLLSFLARDHSMLIFFQFTLFHFIVSRSVLNYFVISGFLFICFENNFKLRQFLCVSSLFVPFSSLLVSIQFLLVSNCRMCY